MKKQYIEFKCTHQKITRTDDFFVVGGSKNYLHARFDLCEDWAGEQVMAIFEAAGKPYKRLIENGECCVPWEVLQCKNFFVSCVAGSLITSDAAEVKVSPCGAKDGTPGAEPTPSAYEQMVSIMEETKEIAQSVRDDADNGEFKGEPGPKGEPGEIKFVVVNELPEQGEEGTIYLVPAADSGESDLFNEYIFVDGKWERIGGTSVAVDLTDYVKKTDYANNNGKTGVVTMNRMYGIAAINSTGLLSTSPATEEELRAKNNAYRPIAPATLDYAIKVGLTTNTQTLSKEEQAKACEWLGVVDAVLAALPNGDEVSY